jgi:hypothetical protein
MNRWSLLADLVVASHVGYVAFVLLGLLLVLIGGWRGWHWVRNPWFRMIHLTMIAIVVLESLLGIVCPLTTLEDYLRGRAGQTVQQGSFLGRTLHDLIFFDAPPWVFTCAYTTFGTLVVLTMFLIPPRRRSFFLKTSRDLE